MAAPQKVLAFFGHFLEKSAVLAVFEAAYGRVTAKPFWGLFLKKAQNLKPRRHAPSCALQ